MALPAAVLALSLFAAPDPILGHEPQVTEGLHVPGLGAGVATCSTVHDDGGGSAVYVGGSFANVGAVMAPGVFRRMIGFDVYQPVGTWTEQSVLALESFDAGTGPELFAATANYPVATTVHRWDGSSWTPFVTGTAVRALEVHRVAGGGALVLAGSFGSIAGVAAANIVCWDGAGMAPLGAGLPGRVDVLGSLVIGPSARLFAGGLFPQADGSIESLACWDGLSWSYVPIGGSGAQSIEALEVVDLGTGPELIAGGHFTSIDGVQATGIARFDGTGWSNLGSGVGPAVEGGPGEVLAVAASGGGLLVGGRFTSFDGVRATHLVEWTESGWRELGFESNFQVTEIAATDRLEVFGPFTEVNGQTVVRAARARAGGWHPLARGQGVQGVIHDLAAFDDGRGERLIAGGFFQTAGDRSLNGLAAWDGERWSDLSDDSDAIAYPANALVVHDDGAGTALFVGGEIITPAGRTGVGRWDGLTWSSLGGWGGDEHIENVVLDALVFDSGDGPQLHVLARDVIVGGQSLGSIARWDGSAWIGVAESLASDPRGMVVFDDGDGPALHIFGSGMLGASGSYLNALSKWDGGAWVTLSSIHGSLLDAFAGNDGRLVVVGSLADGSGGSAIAGAWDGQDLELLGDAASSGLSGPMSGVLGPTPTGAHAVYVAGSDGVVRWDGVQWSRVVELSGSSRVMQASWGSEPWADGPALHLGGSMEQVGGHPSNSFGIWWAACGQAAALCVPPTGSQACSPSLVLSGVPSASPGQPFVISRSTVSHAGAVLVYGTNGAASAWSSVSTAIGSYPCIAPPAVSLRMQPAAGAPGPGCAGSYSLDFNAVIASGRDPSLVVGQTVHLQVASPAPSGLGAEYSEAIEVTICP